MLYTHFHVCIFVCIFCKLYFRDFRISRSEIQPNLVYLFGVSFLTTLDVYKAYFKVNCTRI